MELVRKTWTKEEIDEFKVFEREYKGTQEDCDWEKRIINTKFECFAKTTTKAREIAKVIAKGNYLEFIDNLEITNMLESLIEVFLLNNIKDYTVYKERLDKFSKTIDNWASCDTLKFVKFSDDDCFKLSNEYMKSNLPFVRRIGVNIYFKLIKNEDNLQKAFELLNSLEKENEYYVNMSGAWLLCEIMTKYRDSGIRYFESNSTNNFIINKGISKCRDSFRVSKEDKDYLLRFKRV